MDKVKAYAVVVTFTDGGKEGVIFSSYKDANDALVGVESGSSLAVEFTEIFEDSSLTKELIEVYI
ncbi:MAG: hypothetical protein PF440_03180 [Thiomicrorhabdus sp.]|jgi:hypothetical protein|nr:hypothetical protein [Thiomicrorhabdus sp.]